MQGVTAARRLRESEGTLCPHEFGGLPQSIVMSTVKCALAENDSAVEQRVLDPDILADLPEDDEQAFVKIANSEYDKLQHAYQIAAQFDQPATHAEREYMAVMQAAIEEFGIDDLSGYGINLTAQFVDAVLRKTAQFTFRQARRNRQYTVAFDPATKAVLHHHLNQIRGVVDKSSDTEWKKDALRARINALAAEIDFGRSGYEKFTALVGGLANTTREAWDQVSPMVKALMSAVDSAKEKETASLPAPAEKKQIEHQKNGFDKQIDDEIPF